LRPATCSSPSRAKRSDGHDYVARAFEAGAAAAVIAKPRGAGLAAHEPTFAVDDTLALWSGLGAPRRAREGARRRRHRLGRQDQRQGNAEGRARSLRTDPCFGGLLQQSLGRAADAVAPARRRRFAVIEIGMNHAGEITPLVAMARPHVALVTTIAPVHIEHLGSLEGIADAKAEIFSGLEPGGVAVLNRDAPQFERLAAAARARAARVATFGADAACDAQLVEVSAVDGGSRVRARVFGRELDFVLGAPGRHMAENALGVLLACDALGADGAGAAVALAGFAPQQGRGARSRSQAPAARSPSSTKATTPIPPRCAPRWRCSAPSNLPPPDGASR
jgi:UDP-N-acetylmuramoyl-tripeptide--D-alanyl-D-alanine ligase